MTVLFIGEAPVFFGMEVQCEKRGWNVRHVSDVSDMSMEISSCHTLCLTTDSKENSPIVADCISLQTLSYAAKLRKECGGVRIPCHLLLRSSQTLWMLQSMSLDDVINEMFEVWPFTMESLWAESLFLTTGKGTDALMPLDRLQIWEKSSQTVHLVVFNLTAMGEAVALQAALVAHYPNFVSNHTKKTRITIVEREGKTVSNMIQRHQALFDNSFFRIINLDKDVPDSHLHKPVHINNRDDFVDIEWEFIQGSVAHPVLQQKLTLWANSETQQLSLVICGENDDRNVQNVFSLPKVVFERNIPVAVQCKKPDILRLSGKSSLYGCIVPFGMEEADYDMSQPLVMMAKYLNYFYEQSFNKQEIPTFISRDEVEKSWQKVSYINQLSNIRNAMTFAVKMRSLGHDVPDWADFYAMTQSELEIMAEVEHNRWSVERLLAGFRPPTDKERDEIIRDISLKKQYKSKYVHVDLCSYRELLDDGQQNDTRQYDRILTVNIPLIVNAIYENE